MLRWYWHWVFGCARVEDPGHEMGHIRECTCGRAWVSTVSGCKECRERMRRV